MDDKQKPKAPQPPEGWRFDPFADVALGKSLFELRDEDWLVSDPSPPDRPFIDGYFSDRVKAGDRPPPDRP